MEFAISFYGATQNVTGSRYLLRANNKNIMVDCGLYQERPLKARNWEDFPFPPAKVDAVVLTHAHLDHCGLLPRLVKAGFTGSIYATRASVDIAKIIIVDSAKINEEDAEFKRRRHLREGRKSPHPYVPLYTVEEAEAVFPKLVPWDFDKPIDLGEGIQAEFIGVGHILGAAAIRFTVKQGEESRGIIFSGDVGRWDVPILRDPEALGSADYVICESTYGDRLHGKQSDIPEELAEVINDTHRRGGNIIIPSFAVERTQELIYYLAQLLKADRIPHLRTFVDSPMAVRVNEVFRRHTYLFDSDTTKLIRSFRMPGITMVRSVAESKSINHIRGSVIVIAGSGMCTGGRIKHHLCQNISRPESSVLFVGYQAEGTLGRIIHDGAPRVRILGQEYDVKARIAKISGFSAHADQQELCRWLKTLNNKPRKVFVTHGEVKASNTFAKLLKDDFGWNSVVPKYNTTIKLD
ncbi:MAG: MBL fold metallo-hydrolase RNA specificity domain-containing protein [Lentisphaeria bacterium]|jgi:metallo-beta-lactamase family protein